jgi:hypothetical protein
MQQPPPFNPDYMGAADVAPAVRSSAPPSPPLVAAYYQQREGVVYSSGNPVSDGPIATSTPLITVAPTTIFVLTEPCRYCGHIGPLVVQSSGSLSCYT